MKKFICFLVILMLSGCSNKLRFDENGNVHGSGEKKYYYDNSKIKLIDSYEKGQLKDSIWYDKSGNIIQHTKWENGNGIGLYLHENGEIKCIMFYKDSIGNGKAIYFDQDGNLLDIKEIKTPPDIK